MASAALPPLPGAASGEAGPYDPTGLVGQPAAQAPMDGLGPVMQEIREIDMRIQQLGQRFPEAAGDARAAIQALHSMLVRIAANQRAPEPASPNILGG